MPDSALDLNPFLVSPPHEVDLLEKRKPTGTIYNFHIYDVVIPGGD